MGWLDRVRRLLVALGFGYDENDAQDEIDNFFDKFIKPKPVDKALSRKIQMIIDAPVMIFISKLALIHALALVLNAWSYFTVWLRHF